MCRLASCESAMNTASISSIEGDERFTACRLPCELTISKTGKCRGRGSGDVGAGIAVDRVARTPEANDHEVRFGAGVLAHHLVVVAVAAAVAGNGAELLN